MPGEEMQCVEHRRMEGGVVAEHERGQELFPIEG